MSSGISADSSEVNILRYDQIPFSESEETLSDLPRCLGIEVASISMTQDLVTVEFVPPLGAPSRRVRRRKVGDGEGDIEKKAQCIKNVLDFSNSLQLSYLAGIIETYNILAKFEIVYLNSALLLTNYWQKMRSVDRLDAYQLSDSDMSAAS
ncbi:conserved hypothetical protein [Ricinus communis]|uniref:Uncharacterized protein n=1 Tax=Ricinus communis TaxID=3988 RepID=B9T4F2_RICCO|nr:conserved hypothetical protein [Ricinus communis]